MYSGHDPQNLACFYCRLTSERVRARVYLPAGDLGYGPVDSVLASVLDTATMCRFYFYNCLPDFGTGGVVLHVIWRCALPFSCRRRPRSSSRSRCSRSRNAKVMPTDKQHSNAVLVIFFEWGAFPKLIGTFSFGSYGRGLAGGVETRLSFFWGVYRFSRRKEVPSWTI